MKIHAVAHQLWKWHVPLLPTLLYALNRFLFAVDLPAGTHIGRGSVLKHYGLGTVIHRRAIIGERVFINPGVVIGGRSGHKPVPVIEDDVEIGVGAKVLGPVRIGRGAVVGANAVVLHDVPPGAVVVGIPARILRMSTPNPEISQISQISPRDSGARRLEDTGT
jgi:serine O-acetyltransferase